MNTFRITASFAALALVLTATAGVQDCLPKKPADQDHLVFQYTPFLSQDEIARLDAKLVEFARETSNQIAVVVVDDLCGNAAAVYAAELGQRWGIGRSGEVDNGVVVLIQPTGPPNMREVFIATGQGLEGAIPDAICGRIVNDILIPNFKKGTYYQGLDRATDDLMKLAKGEINAKSYGRDGAPWPILVGILLFIVLVVVMSAWQAKRYAKANNIDLWTAMWLLQQARRRHGGSWGGFTGGGGGWRGGGGGSFGGFGGGSFGGGGAGGRW